MSESHSTAPVEYRQVPGFPLYRVGDDGSVWSKHNKRYGEGKVWKKLNGNGGNGRYKSIRLRPGRVPWLIHRLVLETFVGPCPDGMEACHSNDIKHDNRLENLHWGTRTTNQVEAYDNNRRPKGESHWKSKLSEADVKEIRLLRSQGSSVPFIANKFSVDKRTIYAVVNRASWRYI